MACFRRDLGALLHRPHGDRCRNRRSRRGALRRPCRAESDGARKRWSCACGSTGAGEGACWSPTRPRDGTRSGASIADAVARPGEESAGAFEYRDKGGLVVTADPEKADDLHEVARDLRDAGVRVDVVPDPTEVEPPTFVLAVGYGFTAQPELAQTLRRRLTSGRRHCGRGGVGDPTHLDPGRVRGRRNHGSGRRGPRRDRRSYGGACGGRCASVRTLVDSQDGGRRFANGLARAFAVHDGWMTWLTDDTVVCR